MHFSSALATTSILLQNKLRANSENKVFVADLVPFLDEPTFTRQTLELPSSNPADYFVGLKFKAPRQFTVKAKVTKPAVLVGRPFVRLEYIHEGDLDGATGEVTIFGIAPGVPFPNNLEGHLAYLSMIQEK